MRIIQVAIKDWMQIFRDWKSGLFLVIMPILFTLFFGMVMGPSLSSSSAENEAIKIGIINQDADGKLVPYFLDLAGNSSAVAPELLTGDQSDQIHTLVKEGEIAAAVILPAGFSEDLLADNQASLEVIVDQSSPAGQSASTAVETAFNRLRGAVETAHLSTKAFEANQDFSSKAARDDYVLEAVDLAVQEWKNPPLAIKSRMATGPLSPEGESGSLDGFVQASSGMIVQFAIFGLITSAMVLLLERKTKTLQRLLTTPITRVEVIAGHMLAMFAVVFLQQALLMGFGDLVFKVGYFQNPLPVLIMMTALALWASALGLLISTLARGEEQVVTLSLIAMFLFASLGGAWFPLEVAGKTFSRIGHLLPTAWAMDGFQNILMRGLGIQSVLLPAAILLAYALVFFGAAIWQFRAE